MQRHEQTDHLSAEPYRTRGADRMVPMTAGESLPDPGSARGPHLIDYLEVLLTRCAELAADRDWGQLAAAGRAELDVIRATAAIDAPRQQEPARRSAHRPWPRSGPRGLRRGQQLHRAHPICSVPPSRSKACSRARVHSAGGLAQPTHLRCAGRSDFGSCGRGPPTGEVGFPADLINGVPHLVLPPQDVASSKVVREPTSAEQWAP